MDTLRLKFPTIKSRALKLWSQADKDAVLFILRDHWCVQCNAGRKMQLDSVDKIQCDLLLIGTCSVCGGEMRRVFEMG